MDYLTKQAGQTTEILKCVLLMDRAAVLYLWESWVRGKKCTELESRQVDREEGIVSPGWSKTVQSKWKDRTYPKGRRVKLHDWKC
jgi:hypothetical protein